MREIKVKLYQYGELSEDAKEKARDWYREGYDGQHEWDYIEEDAKEIGLEIRSLRPTGIQGRNEGRFLTTAKECAEKILKNHGKTCETYKTAQSYIADLRAAFEREMVDDADGDDEKIVFDFLYDLLEDYRVMLEKEVKYQNSDEVVAENIEANECEFIENGQRA